MFAIGDYVLYGTRGICKIEDIADRNNGLGECYILTPAVSKEKLTIAVPLSNSDIVKNMRALITPSEIDGIIANLKEAEPEWIDNDKERQNRFSEVLKSGDRFSIMKMIRDIYCHERLLHTRRKKLHLADEKAFKAAEALIYDEFAFVLNIQRTEVINYIANRIDG